MFDFTQKLPLRWYNIDMAKKYNIETFIKDVHHHKIIYNEQKERVEDNLEELLAEAKNEYCYVGIAGFVHNYFEDHQNTKWKLKAIFHLGFPYSFPYGGVIEGLSVHRLEEPEKHPNARIYENISYEPWFLFIFTTDAVESIFLSFNNNEYIAYKYQNLSAGDFTMVERDEDLFMPCFWPIHPYNDYYKTIQKVLEKGRLIERRKEYERFVDVDFEFNEIPYENFSIDYLSCLYRYKKSVVATLGLPTKDERLVELKNQVQFVQPKDNKQFDVQKNDIIVRFIHVDGKTHRYSTKISLANKATTNVKASVVIRSFNISPYYILTYLESDFVKEWCFHNFLIPIDEDSDDESLGELFIEIEKLPILVKNNMEDSFYKRQYEYNKYEKLPIQRKIESSTKIGFFDKNAKEIILRDMNELKQCFTAGAYKASIILAGSILEAFLIDWLSEINGNNYFEEDYVVFDKYRNQERRADLKDYIDAIQELKKPSWYDAAKKATEIRKKRNLVHTKLYIDNKDISKETCNEVISYLEYVINTRWRLKG